MGVWPSNRVFRRAVLLTAYGVSAALVSVGLVPASQVWADTTPPPSPSPVEQVAPASGGVVDFPSAVIQARATGKRVEVTAERSESSSTWVNADGSVTTEQFAAPVRFKNDKGEWAPLNTDLVEKADGSLAPHVSARGSCVGG